MYVGRKKVKLKKAMMISKMKPMLKVSVTVAGPKGRRSNVAKPIAGDIPCGTAAKLALEIFDSCMSDLVQLAPN